MLFKIFYVQWYDSNPHDWATQVKLDLDELRLPTDLDTIGMKTTFSWKILLKEKSDNMKSKSY